MKTIDDAAVEKRANEKRAKEIFEQKRKPGQTWDGGTSPRGTGVDVGGEFSIGKAGRERYRAIARKESRQKKS